MAFDISKFLPRFTEEARELVKSMEEHLVALESGQGDNDTIHEIFRSAHKIKGSSKMLKLLPISDLAHKLEDIFSNLRDEKLEKSPTLFTAIFKAIDLMTGLVEKAARMEELEAIDEKYLADLDRAARGETPSAPLMAEEKPPVFAIAEKPKPLPAEEPALVVAEEPENLPEKEAARESVRSKTDTVRIKSENLDHFIKLMGEAIDHFNRLYYKTSGLKEIEKNVHALADTLGNHAALMASSPQLFSRAGQIEDALQKTHREISEELNILEVVSMELQERVLALRMLPLNSILDSLPRSVRDLSNQIGKNVFLQMSGIQTEIDKKIIDKLGDPILHIVRNAIDHGIESNEERLAAGKKPEGLITLTSAYEGGNVVIKIEDDGRGLAYEKIKEKAVRKNLISADKAEFLTESELVEFLFHPGFSTAPIITDISGRGVGLDIVRSALREIKGNIQVSSEVGKGTRFTLTVPLSLANLNVLFVRVGDRTVGIPGNFVEEIIRVKSSEVILAANRQVLRLRDQLITVNYIGEMMGFLTDRQVTDYLNIVIINSGSDRLGFVIDEIVEQNDVMLKSLPEHIKNNVWVTGAIINERNEIVLILNVAALVSSAKNVRIKKATDEELLEAKKKVHILVVDDSVNTREIEKSILESYGYMVDLAENGRQGYEKALSHKYHCIITDVDMPEMDAFELAEKLKADSHYRNIPVIIVTSREKAADRQRGIEAGADAYIVKGSFDQSNLLNVIESLI